MSKYSFSGAIESIYFHDSYILRGYFDQTNLVLFFKDAIILGQSFPPTKDRIPSAVNPGDDRYAMDELKVTFRDFSVQSVILVGYRAFDDKENLIEDVPSRILDKDECPSVLDRMLANEENRVSSLSFDEDRKSYQLTFESPSDGNLYSVYFSFSACLFEFDEFGREAWYLTYAKGQVQSADTENV